MPVTTTVGRGSTVLVHVGYNVRFERRDEAADLPGLLSHQFGPFAVGIDVAAKFALEVADTVGVIAWQNENVEFLQQAGRPGLVGVHLAQECENTLISGRLISMDGALEVDSDFAG